MEFQELLKQFRIRTGLAVDRIVRHLGIGRGTYYNWEDGKTLPNEEQLEKLVDLYAEHLPTQSKEEIKFQLFNAYRKAVESRKMKTKEKRTISSEERIAKNLMEDIKTRKTSLAYLAEKTGISERRLSDFLLGLSVPTVEEAEKISEVLDTSPERYLDFLDDQVLHVVLAKNKKIRNIVVRMLQLREEKKTALIEIVEKLIDLEDEK